MDDQTRQEITAVEARGKQVFGQIVAFVQAHKQPVAIGVALVVAFVAGALIF